MPCPPRLCARCCRPGKPPGGSAQDGGNSALILAYHRALHDTFCLINRFVERLVGFFNMALKVIGPLLICLAFSLYGFCCYTFFYYVLPQLEVGFAGQVMLGSLGIWLLSNLIYNYLRAIFMNPGTPPDFSKEMEEQSLTDPSVDSDVFKPPPPRQCKRCSRLKPVRAHHCSVCGKCVLKMDHHCPWINNCVGWENYRHFMLFLLYLAACCIFVICCFFPFFWETVMYPRRRRGTRAQRQYISMSFVIAFSILVALCILGGFHVYLVLTNQTTIEFQSNMMRRKEARQHGEFFRNPYDLGRTRNFQQVFGPNRFCAFRWLLPWMPGYQKPTGNGLQYPSLSRVQI
eukprot:gnl/TRDRNA2_/TRDRNA2_67096_c0_seq2.p1 gnl/TRDRNA2_/TRDRNA2_67096_c0~~gnl/TRDRNA2_/TRDRNA2_67096_c0_seq2.p1  ORF type:complete len:345 (+),score=39.43 gnl/TRDRNA2_/TRDRNA2_67096_c0_seq2:128-1162(+)